MVRLRARGRCCAVLSVIVATMPLASVSPAAASPASPPRDKTLYTTGTSAGPPANFNPLGTGSYTGTQGLLYEPLFLYDPLHAKFIPWLATAGYWSGPTTYRLQVRDGVDWVDSSNGAVAGTLRAVDVAYSVELAVRDSSDPYHADVASVEGASAAGDDVTVSFHEPVGYAEWQEFLWHAPIVPEAVWSKLGRATTQANKSPVATGPMLLYSTSSTQACYRDNPHWWATVQLHLSFKFEYLCDLVSGSSGTGLSELLDDRIDWSNQLLRGIPSLADSKAGGYGIKTYYSGEPYMLPASTVWLQMDTAKAPMGNVDFRRAVAYAIDPAAIASSVYTGTVEVANPTGLLPELRSFVDDKVVHEYGYHYSRSLAKRYLAKSGYRGEDLELMVPEGWPDLLSAATVICHQLGKVGVHASPDAVPLRARDTDVATGNYEIVINTATGLGPTPWDYFDAVYQLPPSSESGMNSERFSSPTDWALVQEAASTPLTATTALLGIYANLEQDFLEQLPEIPLWYSGAWFEANTQHWGNYPASSSRDDSYTPVMWPGWLGSTTTVLALAALEPR